ncbi:MAG TPA: YCF48-related protein, partial [Pyrinomonadaceae bacterium]|nr:YCF48-related protein [Pyrinomonadaceae bacterium]
RFATAARGYAVGEGGLILRTDDGGETWKDQESPVKINLYAVAAASPNDALVVGEQGRVLQTKDGGQTWEMQPTITSTTLFSVAYHGGSAAWVAGRGGTILRRTDDVATVKIPRPKLPSALRGGPPKLQTKNAAEELPVVIDDDIPRAQPPPENKRTAKP